MTKPLALVIDDEPDICELLTLTLGRMDIATFTAANLVEARQQLKARQFDICPAHKTFHQAFSGPQNAHHGPFRTQRA